MPLDVQSTCCKKLDFQLPFSAVLLDKDKNIRYLIVLRGCHLSLKSLRLVRCKFEQGGSHEALDIDPVHRCGPGSVVSVRS